MSGGLSTQISSKLVSQQNANSLLGFTLSILLIPVSRVGQQALVFEAREVIKVAAIGRRNEE